MERQMKFPYNIEAYVNTNMVNDSDTVKNTTFLYIIRLERTT